jgi:hypothetical protein
MSRIRFRCAHAGPSGSVSRTTAYLRDRPSDRIGLTADRLQRSQPNYGNQSRPRAGRLALQELLKGDEK